MACFILWTFFLLKIFILVVHVTWVVVAPFHFTKRYYWGYKAFDMFTLLSFEQLSIYSWTFTTTNKITSDISYLFSFACEHLVQDTSFGSYTKLTCLDLCVQKKNKISGFFWTNVFLICTFTIMSMKSTRVDTRPPVTWPLINLCASQVKPTEQSGKDIRISPPSYRCVNTLLLLYQFNFWTCILCVFNNKSKEKKTSQRRQLEDVHDCWITERRVWKVKELSQDHWWLHFKNKQTLDGCVDIVF